MEGKTLGQRLSFVLGVVVLLLVLVGAMLLWIKLATRTVLFEVSGTSGMKLSCQLVIDGDKNPPMILSIPTSFDTRGRSVGYSLENIDDPGTTMTVRVLVDDKMVSTTTVEEGRRLVGKVEGLGGFSRVEPK